jgi:quinol monooxygenase YgiN
MKYVIGWLQLKPGQRGVFMQRVRPFVALACNEPGVLIFEVNPSDADPDIAVWTECYESEDAHRVHQATCEHQALLADIARLAVSSKFTAIYPQSVKTDEFGF